ncbi:MAG: STN domain-containing protein, partial [Opitutaceae bacterium]|nr:STN domain-containing protein [Opitutaceae bacterium]
MTRPSPVRLLSLVLGVAAAALLAAGLAFAADAPRKPFDVPADVAEASLRKFSAQAGLDVLFATRTAGQVRTNAVKGDFTPNEAIDRLLAGTDLVAARDDRTGTFTVSRAPASPAPRPPDTSAALAPVLELETFSVTSDKAIGYRSLDSISGSNSRIAVR